MRKAFLFSIVLFIATSTSFAGVVTPERAAEYAGKFFSGPATKGSPARVERVIPKYHAAVKSGASEDLFYIFNNLSGKGFVIISAEDAARPVIGYSYDADFTDEVLPAHITSWFRSIEDQIQFLRENNIQATSDGKREWSGLMTKGMSGEHTPLKLYITALWNQNSPYSDKCPTNCVTGCVQTAIAIKMKYHEFPSRPTQDIVNGYYLNDSWVSNTVKASETEYKWDMMLNDYSSSASTEQKNAVAVLMADLGVMMSAKYETGGSTGALSGDIAKNMIKYMQYNKAAVCASRDKYPTFMWCEMLRNELDTNGPVVYSGSSKSGGHCFILDGYATGNFFHINWGWGGTSNGWFLIDVFQTKNQGIGGNNGDAYSFYQDAQIGLIPDENGSSVGPAPNPDYYVSVGGITVEPEEIFNGSSLAFSMSSVKNGGQNYIPLLSFYFYLNRYNTGSKESLGKSFTYSDFPIGKSYSIPKHSDFSIIYVRLGDYIWPSFKVYESQGSSWKALSEITEFASSSFLDKIPVIDAAFIIAEDSYSSGDIFKREIFYGRKIPNDIIWIYDGYEVYDDIRLTRGKHKIEAQLIYDEFLATETIVREIIVE